MDENEAKKAIETIAEGLERTGLPLEDFVAKLGAASSELARHSGILGSSFSSTASGFRNLDQTISDSSRGLGDSVKALEAHTAEVKEQLEIERIRDRAIQQSISSATSFAGALLSSETKLSKYGSTITDGTNALGTMVSTMGKFGPLAEIAIKGLGMLANSALQYSDHLLGAADDLGKMGAAGTLTTEEIRKLAAQAHFTTDTMGSWTKAIGILGPSAIALGGNFTEGVKSFGKLTELTRSQINHYQALGYSQGEMVAAQAESIGYYTRSGVVITEQMKTSGRLKEMTTEYMENLSQLSSLTGKNRDDLKKDRDLAVANLAVQSKLSDMDRKRRELEAKGDTTGAKKIFDQMEGAKNALTAAQAAGASQSDMIAMSKAFATGQAVSSKEGGAMTVGGGTKLLEQFVRMGNGTASERDMKGVPFDYANYQDKAQQKFGHVLPFLSEEQAGGVGVSTKGMSESRKYIKSEEDIQKTISDSNSKPEGGTVAEGDSTQKGRFTSNEMTNAAEAFKDGVISFIGPMKLAVAGFFSSVVMFGLSVAANFGGLGKIAGSLSKVGPAISSATSKIGPVISSAAGKMAGALEKAGPAISSATSKIGPTISSAAGKMAPLASGAGKIAGKLAGALEKAGPAISSATSKIGPVISSAAGKMAGALEKAGPAISSATSKIGPVISSAAGKMAPLASGAGKIAGKLAGPLSKVGPAISSATSKIGPVISSAAGKMAPLASGAGKIAGKLSGPLAVATAAYEGYSTATKGWSKANEDVASGKISKSEGAYKKSQAVGEGAGTAVGGGLGGWGGAAAGAAIGSVVPVVGTLIGGLIGGALGAWGGGAIGGAVGKGAGSVVGVGAKALTSDEKESEEQKQVEETGKLTEGPKSIYEQLKKLLMSSEIKEIYGKQSLMSGLAGGSMGIGFANRKMPQAADGGIFDGPKSGYPVMLHGKEAVIPDKKQLPSPVDLFRKMLGQLGSKTEHLDMGSSSKYPPSDKEMSESVSILKKFNIQLYDATENLTILNEKFSGFKKSKPAPAKKGPRMPEDATSVEEAKRLGAANPQRPTNVAEPIPLGGGLKPSSGGPGLKPGSGEPGLKIPADVGKIGNLSEAESAAYAATVAKRESGGKIDAVNSLGYAGKYQFGASALVDNGILDKAKVQEMQKAGMKNKEIMADESIWKNKGGREAFLKDEKLQDSTFRDYTNKNLAGLKKAGVISENSSKGDTAGYLMAAHLKGVGGARDLANGKDNADAYGTKASDYYKLGSNSISGPGLKAPTGEGPGIKPSEPTGLGLKMKGEQATAGGANSENVTNLAKVIQKNLGGDLKQFTAFNDKYHQGTNSAHVSGNAMDLTLNDPKKAAEITKYLQTLPGVKKVINEYADPSGRSTGGHLHVEADAKTNAELRKMLGESATTTAKAAEKASVASEKVSAKPRESYLAGASPKVDASRDKMAANSPAAQIASNETIVKPNTNNGVMDAISALGDRLSGHFDTLIGHTADGNSDLKKLQKNMA